MAPSSLDFACSLLAAILRRRKRHEEGVQHSGQGLPIRLQDCPRLIQRDSSLEGLDGKGREACVSQPVTLKTVGNAIEPRVVLEPLAE